MTAWQIIVAVSMLGGIVGGMGMGGGTLLIPLLTFAAGLDRHLAQAVNLFAFLPMSIAALVIHGKNGYVRLKSAVPIIVLAAIGTVCGSFLAAYAGGYMLRALYGVLLICLGVRGLIVTVVGIIKKRAKKNER